MLKSKMEIRLTIGWLLLLLRACLFSASPAIRATGIGNSNDGSSSESEEEHSSDSQILFPNPIYPIRSPEEDSPAEDGSLESESFERNDGVRNQSDGILHNQPNDHNDSPDGHVPLAGGGSENSGQVPNESEDNKIAGNSLESSVEIGDENGTEGGQGQDVIEEDQQPVEEGGIRVDLLAQKKHVGDIVQLWDESEIDGNMRNALKSTSNNRWTQLRDKDGKYVIPYVITGQFNQAQRQTILKGMDAIDQNTCIRFKARQTESDYVDIQNRKDEGCYTTVGRLRGRQVLMLESGWQRSCGRGCTETFPGCVNHGTVVHELMHKIGLWHEQMRFDRDKYIRINWQNIVPGFQNQFNKINEAQSTVFNLPYDFKSIMHYGKNSGARDRTLVTMQTHEARFQDVIGTAKDASTQDYQKICSIYQCARCMGRPFSPLRSLVSTYREQQSDANADVDTENEDNNSTAIGDEPNSSKCEPLNQECDQGIQPGHSLYNLYCCPKCEQCEPRPFCSSVHPVEQKILYETFCCGRCI